MAVERPIAVLPFHRAQEVFNRFYYQRGSRYAEDFRTYASSGTQIAYSEADDHHAYFRHLEERGELPDQIRVLELGGGNGNNAARYLERLKALDRKERTRFYEMVHYVLTDFSKEMLQDAWRNELLRRHIGRVSMERMDAMDVHAEEPFLCVRFNELYDDLPTKIILIEGGRSYEVYLAIFIDPEVKIRLRDGRALARKEFALLMEKGGALLNEVDGSIVGRMEFEVNRLPADVDVGALSLLMKSFGTLPENYLIPIPLGASENLLQLRRLLAKGGRVDFFDYGFIDLKELASLQSSIFRTPGALTTFVNFPFLSVVSGVAGFSKVLIEPQKAYIERVKKGRFTHKMESAKTRRSRDHFYHVHMSF